MSTTMVPGFRHLPGHHCGSTALRNLLGHHGAELTEEMAFGLGAGACFYFVPMDGSSPSRFTNGRTSRLEEQFVELTGAPLELLTFEDAEASWDAARASVEDGSPALLLTDLYYLDHYGKSAHFPGHAVVLAGFDDDVAYLSDTAFDELQTTSIESLHKARHAQHPVFPLAGHMFVARNGIAEFDPGAAVAVAVTRCAERMLEPPLGEYEGLPGLRRFAAEVGSWPELLSDWQWSARFNYQTIERRGTGGGNFRLMYSRFLGETGSDEAEQAANAAAAWTELATGLLAASEDEEPAPGRWEAIGAQAANVLEVEERLWDSLAGERPS
jgi:hypothetical protein